MHTVNHVVGNERIGGAGGGGTALPPSSLSLMRKSAKSPSLGKNPRKCLLLLLVNKATAHGNENLNVATGRLKQRIIPSLSNLFISNPPL